MNSSLGNSFIRKLEKLGQEKAKTLAKEAREKLTNEYIYTISIFYGEYEPQYYKRHPGGGLYKTYKKYYRNPHNTIYYGGVEITPENMYDDYHDQPIEVLNSFLEGYHGRPSLGIDSSVQSYRHMLKYRDLLINDFTKRCTVK